MPCSNSQMVLELPYQKDLELERVVAPNLSHLETRFAVAQSGSWKRLTSAEFGRFVATMQQKQNEIEPTYGKGAFDIRTVSTIDYDDLLQRLVYIEKILETHGIKLKPTSRVDQYRQAITTFREMVLKTSHSHKTRLDWQLLSQAVYEIDLITDAMRELLKPPEVFGWEKRVTKVLSGQIFPQNERPDTSPRSFQYEIQLASAFRKAGYGVSFDEPDIVVTHPEMTFGIAAKRPLSRGKIYRNLRDGARQIVTAGHDEIVALDLTVLHNPRNILLTATNASEALLDLELRTNHFLKRNSSLIRASIKEFKVFGVLVSLNASYLEDSPCFASATRWAIMNLCALSDPRCQILIDFTSKLGQAIGTRL